MKAIRSRTSSWKLSNVLLWPTLITVGRHEPERSRLKSRDNEEQYIELFHRIAEHGVWEEFQGKAYQYYYPGDGYKYWRMTDLLSESQIINRAAVDAQTQDLTA
jgi:hypothetical protein